MKRVKSITQNYDKRRSGEGNKLSKINTLNSIHILNDRKISKASKISKGKSNWIFNIAETFDINQYPEYTHYLGYYFRKAYQQVIYIHITIVIPFVFSLNI